MANLVYKRVSTDQQSTDRQNLVLDEAGIEDPVVFEEQAGTSSRLHPLERPKFGELLSTVKFMVQTLAAAGELQRDLQRELTYDGLRAAEAKGKKGGRRPAVAADKTDAVRTAYLEGRSIAALARDHHLSRGAIRTAVADLLPEYTAADPPDALAPELPVVLDMPGKIADFLRASDLDDAERATLDQGVTVRRGQGYTLRVTAPPAIHRRLLDLCQPLDGTPGTSAVPAQRKAHREYESRVNALATDTL
ncbi:MULTISPECIES: hypothetical protein [unclassified Streptomyces]|uniref:hypothetical protein n=1 Tax=unclassified Streptomyces TaxID=2593676 RepID=UPI002DDA82C6|nr:hypothetical protein [Streptomyces sp. NBC_01751]WSD24997.1 hypothetical protein OHA26_16685 [Streptomyces sp. NBC_01751]WSF86525.1 hypothetical protein OIE70_27570 [Streptomyces sp. NBC_01744]